MPERVPRPRTLQRRILVVDDDRTLADAMCRLLQELGHRAVAAYSLDAALAVARELRPDGALIDVRLGADSGFDICRGLRDQVGGDALQLIAISGSARFEDINGALDCGFDDYLVKPFGLQMLDAALRGSFRRQSCGRN